MSIQMTAVISQGNTSVPAPYKSFAKNENVAAYNEHFRQMHADKEFCQTIGLTGEHIDVPEMNATSQRRAVLKIIFGITFEEPVKHLSPAQVAAMADVISKTKDTSALILKAAFGINKQDYVSMVEFFEICAKEGYGIFFS